MRTSGVVFLLLPGLVSFDAFPNNTVNSLGGALGGLTGGNKP